MYFGFLVFGYWLVAGMEGSFREGKHGWMKSLCSRMSTGHPLFVSSARGIYGEGRMGCTRIWRLFLAAYSKAFQGQHSKAVEGM